MRWLTVVSLLLILSACNTQDKGGQKGTQNAKTMTDRFMPPDWVRGTTIYEVNIRQYTPEGTFNAFAGHLPRLKELGVKTLWFMPVTPIAQKNKKGSLGSYYACSDYTSINPEFGTLEDFKSLVSLAHELGFKVILDWVANHTGWDHHWTVDHPDYYLKDSATHDFLKASGMDDIIELDFNNPALRKEMTEAMKFWVKEFDIDGFRCDLASWVELDYWLEARPLVDAVKPLFWLGEYDELEKPEYGKAFDASYSWGWMHRTEDFFKKQLPLDTLTHLLHQYDALGDTTIRAWFTTNHDENSWNGTEFEKYGSMFKALAVFSFTWNGIPLLYSGQELGNTKRIDFFDKDTIVAGPWATELTGFYQSLIKLKSTHPALRAGDTAVSTFRLTTTDDRHVLAYLRKYGEREVLVVLNLSDQGDLHFDISSSEVTGIFKNAFSGAANDFTREKSFELQAWEFAVYEK
jgi:alpha-amylase